VSTTPAIASFAPVFRNDATALVLGSVPGEASLRAAAYYAHPRNAFWPIVAAVYGFDAAAPYGERVASLIDARVALWDVVQTCERHGSLDASIVGTSVVANDIAGMLVAAPAIDRVVLNGQAAAALFRRHAAPAVVARLGQRRVRVVVAPSTSPAHAARTFEAKLAVWRDALIVDG
jgi:TDG/mug DNA glycosylase family protein